MTIENLSLGNYLQMQIIEAYNEVHILTEWLDELRRDEAIMICSHKEPQEKYIIELHGRNVIPFVEQRLKEQRNHLEELEAKFKKL